jgi:hypothetical protein
MIATLATIGLVLFVVGVTCAVVIEWRYPMRDTPREKFNSAIPLLLGASACTFLGFIFYRRHFATSGLRTHEWYHWLECRRKGRWTHLVDYIADLLGGLLRYGLRREPPHPVTGKRYFSAYWMHPEEIEARVFASNPANARPALGQP